MPRRRSDIPGAGKIPAFKDRTNTPAACLPHYTGPVRGEVYAIDRTGEVDVGHRGALGDHRLHQEVRTSHPLLVRSIVGLFWGHVFIVCVVFPTVVVVVAVVVGVVIEFSTVFSGRPGRREEGAGG